MQNLPRSVSSTTAQGWTVRSFWRRCVQGAGTRLRIGRQTDLGRFGLGLKTASFSQCRRLTVLTSRNGVVSTAIWDLDMVAARDRWVVELPDSTDGIPWSDRLDGDGTLVVWQKLDRLVGRPGPR